MEIGNCFFSYTFLASTHVKSKTDMMMMMANANNEEWHFFTFLTVICLSTQSRSSPQGGIAHNDRNLLTTQGNCISVSTGKGQVHRQLSVF